MSINTSKSGKISPGKSLTTTSIDTLGFQGIYQTWKYVIWAILCIGVVPFWMFCYLVFLAAKQEMLSENNTFQYQIPRDT